MKPIKLTPRSSLKTFIAFFERIPANKWCKSEFVNDSGQMCARGHVGARCFHEHPVDVRLSSLAPEIADHNNGRDWMGRPIGKGKTIKSRVLNYLRSLL